jgi:hypothetical protein
MVSRAGRAIKTNDCWTEHSIDKEAIYLVAATFGSCFQSIQWHYNCDCTKILMFKRSSSYVVNDERIQEPYWVPTHEQHWAPKQGLNRAIAYSPSLRWFEHRLIQGPRLADAQLKNGRRIIMTWHKEMWCHSFINRQPWLDWAHIDRRGRNSPVLGP